jgi:PDZ domain-containing protein
MTENTRTALVALVIFVAMAATIVVAPVGFVAWAPGRTVDLLSTAEPEPIVDVTGTPTFPTTGTVLLTTVSQTSAEASLRFPQAVLNYLLPNHDVRPWSRVYEPGATATQVAEQEQAAMAASQHEAVVAALRVAGLPVKEFARITAVPSSAPAADHLRAGDIVVTVNNKPVTTVAQAVAEVRSNSVGAIVPVAVRRRGVEWLVEESVRLGSLANDPETATLGVTWQQGYEHAAHVAFHVPAEVGGNSAGLALGLAVYDLVTPGDLTGGQVIAATGSLQLIEPTTYRVAEVNRISAVREKVAAAERQGATILLLPQDNCADLKRIDSVGLRIIPVTSFHAAVEILTDLAERGDDARVPRC